MQSFDVKGMDCEHCVSAIKAAIQSADPDARVEVDLATGKVVVSDETAPQDVLLEAIAAEGYEAIPSSP